MRRLGFMPLSFLAAAVLAAVLFGGNAMSAAAAGSDYTCTGGSIPSGNYSSVTVSGPCAVDSGSVSVSNDLTVKPGGALYAAFGGSDLSVGRDLLVGQNGVLVLGCEPEAFVCFNDPDQVVGTMSTSDTIGGSLRATQALAVLVHHNAIDGRVTMTGGGGGVNCDPQDALFGFPAYGSFEDNTIGGNVVIADWQSCWLGFFRNDVTGNVNFVHNVTFDPDGNEIQTNTIGGRLNCAANSPAPQSGDSGGSPNTAARGAAGQCADLVAS